MAKVADGPADWVPQKAPYPAGPMPLGQDPPEIPAAWRWSKRRWEVYCLLHHGYTSKSAAAELGMFWGTIERYRSVWKKRFDLNITARAPEDCLTDPRYQKPRDVAQVEGAEEISEEEHLTAALMARSVVNNYLKRFTAGTPEATAALAKLSPAEVKAIQEIGMTAERAARGDLAPAKGRTAAKAPDPKTPAQSAMQGLSKPVVRKGRKGEAAESAGGTVSDLRSQLAKFRDAVNSAEAV